MRFAATATSLFLVAESAGVWGTPANFNGFRVLAALLHSTLVHCVSKNIPPLQLAVIFYIHSSIATIFGTNVAEKSGNQNVLYFPTSPN